MVIAVAQGSLVGVGSFWAAVADIRLALGLDAILRHTIDCEGMEKQGNCGRYFRRLSPPFSLWKYRLSSLYFILTPKFDLTLPQNVIRS